MSTATGLISVPSSMNGPSTLFGSDLGGTVAEIDGGEAVVRVQGRIGRPELDGTDQALVRPRVRRTVVAPAPTAIRGAVPDPSVPPVAAAVRPPDRLTSDAPMRMPATAMATARSCPSRQSSGRRGSPIGRSTTSGGLADGRQARGHDHRVDTALHLACGCESPVLEGPGAGASVFLGSAQASHDALDADRCIQQYGLLALDGRGALGVGAGLGLSTVRVAVSSWGLYSRPKSRLMRASTSREP